MDAVENFWDDCRKNKVMASLSGSHYDETIDFLRIGDYMKSVSTVLEIGPGIGYTTEELFNKGFKVSCLDISNLVLEGVQKFCERIYTVDELEKMPSDYFDLIFSVNVIQHIPTETLVDELKHCIRSLKSTGVFAVEFVSGNCGDGGVNPMMDVITKGGCIRSPEVMGKLVDNAGGIYAPIQTVPVNGNPIVIEYHVWHIRRKT
jgi:cyclopropane fatty-acyl-phospholipid synthase-like methyltransferase